MRSAPPLTRYKRELDEYLRALITDRHPQLLYRMAWYHLGWEDADGHPAEASGKGLRSYFCLLACEAAGGEPRRALPAAAAVDLVHNFSLVHDDIEDRDEERHGRATVWKLWGEPQAINAGDALLAIAHLSVLRLADERIPAEEVVAAARVLDERTLEMVEGQTLDLSFEERLDVDVPAYIEMVEKKSGALFDCALHLGGLVAGADDAVVLKLGAIGRTLGTAFQMRDDVLGIWGDDATTGKPSGADIGRRKKSLPVVYALKEARGASRDELRALYGGPELDHDGVVRAIHLIEESGAREFCTQKAQELKESALAELDRLDLDSEPAVELRNAAEFLLERNF